MQPMNSPLKLMTAGCPLYLLIDNEDIIMMIRIGPNNYKID